MHVSCLLTALTPPTAAHVVGRESFLPGSKARTHNSQQEAAYGPDSVGKYDPILHKWILEPDQEKWQARERAHANEVSYRNIVIAVL